MVWAWDHLVWVECGVPLKQDTGFGSSGGHRARRTPLPAFGPRHPWDSVQVDTWLKAPESSAGEIRRFLDFQRSLVARVEMEGHQGGGKLTMGEARALGQQVRGETKENRQAWGQKGGLACLSRPTQGFRLPGPPPRIWVM